MKKKKEAEEETARILNQQQSEGKNNTLQGDLKFKESLSEALHSAPSSVDRMTEERNMLNMALHGQISKDDAPKKPVLTAKQIAQEKREKRRREKAQKQQGIKTETLSESVTTKEPKELSLLVVDQEKKAEVDTLLKNSTSVWDESPSMEWNRALSHKSEALVNKATEKPPTPPLGPPPDDDIEMVPIVSVSI